jgi:hypothetical protein
MTTTEMEASMRSELGIAIATDPENENVWSYFALDDLYGAVALVCAPSRDEAVRLIYNTIQGAKLIHWLSAYR